jgi:cytochrome c biogenesis protein CcdA
VAVRRETRGAVLLAAFCFTLGFATVFVALGAGASTIGMVLRRHLDILAQIGGVIIILMGLHFLGLLRIGLFAREARFQGGGKPATASGAYIMGLAFAFGWTPCIGPVLGAILGVAAARETVGDGAVLLAVYSLGLAVPFWIAAGFSGAFMRFLMRFRRHLGTVEKVIGAFCWSSPASPSSSAISAPSPSGSSKRFPFSRKSANRGCDLKRAAILAEPSPGVSGLRFFAYRARPAACICAICPRQAGARFGVWLRSSDLYCRSSA